MDNHWSSYLTVAISIFIIVNGQKSSKPKPESNASDESLVKVDGVWSDYYDASVCYGCGGSKLQNRVCTPPKNGGKKCQGTSIRQVDCTPCPIHGKVGEWIKEGTCTATCDGKQKFIRKCDNPAPQFGGRQCTGQDRVTWTGCYPISPPCAAET